MTPAENKQTVEALADAVMFAFDNALDAATSNFATRVQARKDFAAALRDLVAQADRAAELEAALREIADGKVPTTYGARHHALRQRARAALAGDGGGA